MTRAVVNAIDSVPSGSPLREEQEKLFALFVLLRILHDEYLEKLEEGGVWIDSQEWQEFWTNAQVMLLAIGVELNDNGFGDKNGEQEGEGDKK